MQWLRALLITVGVAQIPMMQSEQQGFSLHQAITMWLWTVLLTWVLLTLVAWLLDRKVEQEDTLRAMGSQAAPRFRWGRACRPSSRIRY